LGGNFWLKKKINLFSLFIAVEMAGLNFYYDLISQPSRAVFMFLKATNIPFVAHKVRLSKGV